MITDPPPHLTLASRAKVFGMRVLGYRRRDLPLPDGVDRMYCTDRGETINPILEQCDVLALVLNLSDATYRLIGRAELARMKPSAIIVNLARGGLIDEAALIDALESGRLGGAGLDVTETEPAAQLKPAMDDAQHAHHAAFHRGDAGQIRALARSRLALSPSTVSIFPFRLQFSGFACWSESSLIRTRCNYVIYARGLIGVPSGPRS